MSVPGAAGPWPLLLRLRERRLDQQRAALAAAQRSLHEAGAAAEQARADLARCLDQRDALSRLPAAPGATTASVQALRDARPWQRVLQARAEAAGQALRAAQAAEAQAQQAAEAQRQQLARASAALEAVRTLQRRAAGAERRAAEARGEERLDEAARQRWRQQRTPGSGA